jgi:predicted Rossmann fold nucleotide-binding protein DprA/Smf involved in DNA uptake
MKKVLVVSAHRSSTYGVDVKKDLVDRLINSGIKTLIPSKSNRSRLLASCDAVLVLEATLEGSAMFTARLALELNRPVLAIPGSIFKYASQGTNLLIQNGAHLVTNYQDVLDFLIKVD